MTLRRVSNLNSRIGEVIDAAGEEGVLLEHKGRRVYAVMPLDGELLDYLLERNPTLMKECDRIRRRMKRGEFVTHDQVKKMLKD